jgi:hypothetical protein
MNQLLEGILLAYCVIQIVQHVPQIPYAQNALLDKFYLIKIVIKMPVLTIIMIIQENAIVVILIVELAQDLKFKIVIYAIQDFTKFLLENAKLLVIQGNIFPQI